MARIESLVGRIGAAGLLLAVGCGAQASPARTALEGELSELQTVLSKPQAWSLGQASVVARALLRRELEAIEPGQEPERYHQIFPCVHAVKNLLVERAGQSVFAVATLVRAGETVSTETLFSEFSEGERRREAMLSSEEITRASAVIAAAVMRDPRDTAALLEVVRLDPSGEVQRQAILALGQMGGQRAVLGLVDRWGGAEVKLRDEILLAWSVEASFLSGGREQLLAVAEGAHDEFSLSAATLLAVKGQADPGLIASVVQKSLDSSQPAVRRKALQQAAFETDENLRQSVEQLASDRSDSVAAVAIARLSAVQSLTESQVAQLWSWANGQLEPQSQWAWVALARNGDKKALQGLLQKLRTAPEASSRLAASRELLALLGVEAIVSGLADDSPLVRIGVACQILRLNEAGERRAVAPSAVAFSGSMQ